MGASNFYNKNASKTFVVLSSYEEKYRECPDCGEKHWEYDYDLDTEDKCSECGCELNDIEEETKYPDNWEYDDLKVDLFESISEVFKANKEVSVNSDNTNDNDRNYCGVTFATVTKGKMFGDVWIEVRVSCIVRSAYYDGANLDWEVEFSDYSDWLENSGDIEINDYNSEMNKGLCAIQQRNARNWAESTKDELVEKIEKVYEENSDAYRIVARASNGETFYEKA